MKVPVSIARLLVGITFVFSGYVKLVDPIGSAIKMEEYLSEDVLNMPYLIPYSLGLALVLIMAELLTGVSLLVGFKPKWTTRIAGVLMAVFLFLTWYSAYYDKVTDCGCFGDAVKLTPWGTFYKNIVLGILVLVLVRGWRYIKPLWSKQWATWLTFLALVGGLYLSYYVLEHLPIHDFRPYAVGKSIPEGMKEVEGMDIPPVHDFILETPGGEDLTDSVLESDKVLLIISYNLALADARSFEMLKNLGDEAVQHGYEVHFLTASYVDDFQELKQQYGWSFDMLYADETTLKTMIRANPGIMMLHKGTVTGKWNWKDIRNIAW